MLNTTKNMKIIAIACLLSLSILDFTSVYAGDPTINEESISALIIGSAEYPDPVLTMVEDLEKKGILTNVIVRESYPVQIDVTGPRSIIKKLQAIPRKVSPSSK